MIDKINSMDTEILKLLTLATSEKNSEKILEDYLGPSNKHLYVKRCNNVAVGCIGINISDGNSLTITHIAVGKPYQRNRNASEMIDFIKRVYKPSMIIAETDNEAVGFYQKYGFKINSLGEKYPNVERFQCSLIINHHKNDVSKGQTKKL
ncbi:hypothetical protein BCR24_11445 [Enterococcus ureilyticus]|uniref:N-acetyltransferase domain-containing protein n=1 Tax=Enterococcus ureilyticus TaxID=1131292 RepID=A0A1E5HEM0_9ENTE|nr:GNAT family N-acetyltransferase [Enterococcus ureilyticus]MBM7687311.1 ribosomal protein S18 acetylase RimI-like enzyme [Enterococcus ureilyticus]MBO0447556.1 GNAT family N-acetyltransferase [Enterococcus ureilyticus]OEG23379.1 hypothetical protein BCR24_11445 [Enterococcus ureilyticus]